MFNENCGASVVASHLNSFYQQLKLFLHNWTSGRLFLFSYKLPVWKHVCYCGLIKSRQMTYKVIIFAQVALTEIIQQGAHFSCHVNGLYSNFPA